MPTIQHHMERAGTYIQAAADTVGAVIATGAVTLPWWRENLHTASSIFADLAPIVGVLWLIIQVAHRLSHWRARADAGGDD